MADEPRWRVHHGHHRVAAGERVDLDAVSTTLEDAPAKVEGKARTAELVERLADLQTRLFAGGTHRVLVVLQAMDTGGKDGLIRKVFGPLNASGVRVVGFGAPTEPELARDFLWRIHAQVPGDGELVVFNRSHYEDVLVVRVRGLVPQDRWRRRYAHIRAFEQLLADEGTTIVKLYLHVSKDEQRERLQARLDDPAKRWKFRKGDLDDRARWGDFRAAYEDAISETSTDQAPWYVVPADVKWQRDLVAAEILVAALDDLELRWPAGEADLDGIVVE